jgi:hypothetical protein
VHQLKGTYSNLFLYNTVPPLRDADMAHLSDIDRFSIILPPFLAEALKMILHYKRAEAG